MKALSQLEKLTAAHNHTKIDVALMGSLEGRVDQALSQLHQLHLSYETKSVHIGNIYLIAQSSVVMLLEKGKHVVYVPVSKGYFTKYAGLVPLAGPVILTTAGFEWNLNDERLEFGHFVSTSNHVVRDTLEVETSNPFIFTLEIDLGSG